jgi:hypothetical protein
MANLAECGAVLTEFFGHTGNERKKEIGIMMNPFII